MLKAVCCLVLCLVPLCGCAGDDPGNEGECSTRIGFKNTIYRGSNAVNQSLPAGEALGRGDLLGCDGSAFGQSAEQVYAVKGVDPSVAILVKADGHGIYVAEGVPLSAWPRKLRVPGSAVRPDQATERSVSSFVQKLQAQHGSGVSIAVDWEENTILVGAAPPVPDDLQRVDGTSVAGLYVDVFSAKVTVSEYEEFAKAVDGADFPHQERVCAFGLAPDSGSITVYVIDLDQMPPDDFADLQDELEDLTDARVLVRQAPEVVYPGSTPGSHAC